MSDVPDTGTMELTQLVRLAKAYTGENPLKGAFKLAGSHTGHENITLTDLVREARILVQKMDREREMS